MVIGADGKILAHLDASRRGLFLGDYPRLDASIESQEIFLKSAQQADVAAAIALNGQRLGWVRVVVAQDETASKLGAILQSGLIYTSAAILLGVLLAWAMARRLTSRLHGLVGVADTVRKGDLRTRAQTSGVDELGHLGQAFNFMLNALEDRARDEQALRQDLQAEKELAQVTLSSIGDAVITTDKAGRVTFMNDSACRLTGVTQAEAIGQAVTDVFPLVGLGTKLPLANPVFAVLDAKGTTEAEFLGALQTHQGRTVAVESLASPIRTADGSVAGGVLVARDVSKQIEAQSRLEEINETLELRVHERTQELALANQVALEREQFIRTVTDSLPSMIGYWDRGLVCRFANVAYENWTGLKVDSILACMPARYWATPCLP